MAEASSHCFFWCKDSAKSWSCASVLKWCLHTYGTAKEMFSHVEEPDTLSFGSDLTCKLVIAHAISSDALCRVLLPRLAPGSRIGQDGGC